MEKQDNDGQKFTTSMFLDELQLFDRELSALQDDMFNLAGMF